MIDLKKLIDFLPFEYKDQDTYKVDGKGILERFLEICGSYFQDNISADIESLLGITDFDTCPEIYLNYLWESFGQLPFARWNNIDEGAFKTYYNGLLSEAELNSLKSKWILPKKGALALTTKQIRDLLKYSISLIKIRGTSQFFEILFRMYGLNCTIDDPAKSGYDGWLKTHPYFDQDQYYDKSNFDNIYGCSQCINVTFHITGHGYSNNSGEFIEFRKAIENIIDRFKPYHVGATIDYGFNINDNYLITADFVDPNINTIQPGYITSVPIKVTVSSNYQNADLRYQVSGDGNTWGYKKYENGTIFNATIGNQTYYFRSVGDPTKVTQVHVKLKEVVKSYNISVNPTTLHITPTNKEVSAIVTATLYQEGKQTPVNIQLVGETEVKPSGSTYKFKEPGTYEFQIVEYPVKRVSLVVTREPNKYKVKCTPEEFKLSSNVTSLAKTILTIEDDYDEEGLECYLIGKDDTRYKSGDTFQTFGTGVYKFACTKDNLENFDGIGIFTVYTSISKFTYHLSKEYQTLSLEMGSGSVNQELYLSVTPSDDPDNLIDYGVSIYCDNTKLTDITLNKSGNGKASATYSCNKPGSYKAVCKGDPSVYTTWSVYSYTKPEDPYIYIEAVNPSDPNWISPKDWANTPNNQKVNVSYQLAEGKSVTIRVMPFEIKEYDSVLLMETGAEYKFEEVITLDKAGTYTFVGKGNKDKKATLVIKDYNLEVKISCSPKRATLSGQGEGEVYTTVVCSSNHKDFITDVRLVGQADSHPVPYEFRTSNPGTYIFEAVNKTDVRCTFEVTLAFDVQPNELVWNSDDISSKTFEIDIPENTAWRITPKPQE